MMETHDIQQEPASVPPTEGGRERASLPRPAAMLEGQNHILERIAHNAPLSEVLESLAWLIESQAPDLTCSILLLRGGLLHHGAAPSLPEAFCRALDGVAIGPSVGSCGTAAFRKQPIVVTDIAHDPLWSDYRQLALQHGLRACWSTPIMSDEGEVLGTFAVYCHEPAAPRPVHVKLLEMATHIAKIAIERHLADEVLKQQAAQLLEADQRKDEFIALLAHELRNPIAPIVTALELMRLRGDDPATAAKYRAMMERQVRHLTRLIDDLLDISRITQGKIELKREPCSVELLVTRAVEQVTPLIQQLRHRLHLHLPPVPIEIHADPIRMAQVLANLLNNAAKYSPPGGDIYVSAVREGDRATIRVRDTGIGMTPETLSRAFDLFAQADRSCGRTQGGLGIGLTLVRRIVEMHGGQVETASAGLNQGSELTVRLPALPERAQGEAPGRPSTAEQGRVLLAGAMAGERILLVDDNVDAAESLAEAIEGAGAEVAVAHDGETALVLAQQWRPRTVLLDISLPGIDGYEVARRLRADKSQAGLRLIALTGYDERIGPLPPRDRGFDAHLVKPTTLARIADALAATVSR